MIRWIINQILDAELDRIVKQGWQDRKIRGLFNQLIGKVKKEYTEDNYATMVSFITELLIIELSDPKLSASYGVRDSRKENLDYIQTIIKGVIRDLKKED